MIRLSRLEKNVPISTCSSFLGRKIFASMITSGVTRFWLLDEPEEQSSKYLVNLSSLTIYLTNFKSTFSDTTGTNSAEQTALFCGFSTNHILFYVHLIYLSVDMMYL